MKQVVEDELLSEKGLEPPEPWGTEQVEDLFELLARVGWIKKIFDNRRADEEGGPVA